MDKRTLGILFFGLFLVMLGFGIIIPALPYYTLEMHGDARTVGFLMASYSIMNVIFAPLWGRLSDRIGRKPIFMTGIAGLGLSFVLFGLATNMPQLFGARILGGILGAAALPTAFAIVGDRSPPEARAKSVGLLGAAVGLGMVVGPAIGGLAGQYSHKLPFFIAGVTSLLTVFFIAAMLPGGLPPAIKHKPTWRQALQETGSALWPLYLLTFVSTFAFTNMEATFVLFAKDRFALTIGQVGGLFATMALVSAGVQGGMVGKLVQKHGEGTIIKTGTAILASGLFFVILAGNYWALTLAMCWTGVGSALMRSALATGVSKGAQSGQGTAMGMLQSFESMARVVGPAVGGMLYYSHPDWPYLAGSLVMAGAFFFALAVLRPKAPQPGIVKAAS
ncbi:MAG: MFS transporter [Candidatus Sericytochromatia bacterium]|nr:MFS transporter [Candidatus Sericytochromatia bacterium]